MSCMLGPLVKFCMIIGCSLALVILSTILVRPFVKRKFATCIAFLSSLAMMITALFLYGKFNKMSR